MLHKVSSLTLPKLLCYTRLRKERERERGRQTDRQTDKTDRQRHRERLTELKDSRRGGRGWWRVEEE